MTNVGWENGKRVYGNIIRVDIINGKLWIQFDLCCNIWYNFCEYQNIYRKE
ncbi:MAG: element excision factor XisI family protein [Candidatus Poribacteria bacterium]